jgi:hypothetical protein
VYRVVVVVVVGVVVVVVTLLYSFFECFLFLSSFISLLHHLLSFFLQAITPSRSVFPTVASATINR